MKTIGGLVEEGQKSAEALPVSDRRIVNERTIDSPGEMLKEFEATKEIQNNVVKWREEIRKVLKFEDDRLLVLAGPCSIHDTEAALEYSENLRAEKEKYADDLLIVMRCYFEKPRTTVGWKGLINDPERDGSFNVNTGLKRARQFLLSVAEKGVPAGTELLDLCSPQYISDLLSWGCIGARTCESQLHRELASGMSCPVGFKNPTSGDALLAVQSVLVAADKHIFLGPSKVDGGMAMFTSSGNDTCHVVLRGGKVPNYKTEDVEATCEILKKHGMSEGLVIDASHGNSGKDHNRQAEVIGEISQQIADGCSGIRGVMMESFLVAGKQSIDAQPLVYGQSITDACIGWDTTTKCLEQLAMANRKKPASNN